MARPLGASNQRGSALLEMCFGVMLLIGAIQGLLFTSYCLFALVFIEYQSEQALHCRASGSFTCRMQLFKKVQRTLPWGTLKVRRLTKTGRDRFELEAEWRLNTIVNLRFHKTLSITDIAKNTALRW